MCSNNDDKESCVNNPPALAVGRFNSPAFEADGTPTDETLDAIEKWQPGIHGDWSGLFAYLKEAWDIKYGAIREEQSSGETLICFITGGWSNNECLQCAMNKNFMFRAMKWHSSYRGGLTKYII